MCIAAWTWQAHPAYGLLLLFNRDEYHSRPTRPAQWWAAAGEEGEEILGGRDELGGGTWLGCTKGGKLAFLTNVREPSPRDGARSRGELPVRYLQVRPSQICSVFSVPSVVELKTTSCMMYPKILSSV
uniref:Transport and Golgi organization 2-like protein n=1 Tax=Aegilops tauschii subsp. strangulata TaxID=200361 RepID=A0A453CMG5_AEGTS